MEDANANFRQSSENHFDKKAMNRRKVLLGGTTLAAAGAVMTNTPTAMAQAQQQPPASNGKKPNILVILGDDIGQANISAYAFGVERNDFGRAQAGTIGHAQGGLVSEPGRSIEQPRHLLGTEHHRPLARLMNEVRVLDDV